MSLSAEILCIGTELLLGEIVNTNAQYLAQQLANLGIPHYYQTVVGDNPIRLKKALAIACERSQLIITTGGLGPTPDDLTTETLSDFFEAPLAERLEVWEDINQKFQLRGIVPSPSNRKQALLPVGAEILPNPVGNAPGMIWQPRTGLTILTFPGVPSELYAMWQETAIAYLRTQGWGQEIIYSRVLRFWGIGESALAERLEDLLKSANPSVAPYANLGEARLRLSARAPDQIVAQQLLEPIEQQIRARTGDYCYGVDDDSLASVVGNQLSNLGQTLGVAESCTGGLLGQMLTDVPGSSAYFRGGVISYDNQIKAELLNVSSADLESHGAVSAPVAAQMAQGARACTGSDWGLGITGIAGPGGGTPAKPVGLVYIGLAAPDGSVQTQEYQFGSSRERSWIRQVGACSALDLLRRKLLNVRANPDPG
ncbi:competence/damage-inducible protein A [Leptolyngbya sp. FACHB-261]|uniref:competence/damage-inducible protein A n=1 Tax=Leptolyngbya sp. FACHB-261 TaxID=2692806 RepID=UPI0016875E02|nr:competence/damage-inducible protein A [Leptolyngbya sp. FACHB-261]MBD2105089.1 competence/damage-inducible protein A [Leptolyngbya sp. FACHB-261]